MRRDTLRLSAHQFIETGKDFNGRFFIAYSSGASVFIRSIADLRKFLKIPKSLPMRAALDSWLASLADMDNERTDKAASVTDRNTAQSAELSPELLATGFGPEAHLDESDPNYQTRVVV